jgi:hypothetical protein
MLARSKSIDNRKINQVLGDSKSTSKNMTKELGVIVDHKNYKTKKRQ